MQHANLWYFIVYALITNMKSFKVNSYFQGNYIYIYRNDFKDLQFKKGNKDWKWKTTVTACKQV